MKNLQIEQNTPEWHQFREKHIGSSDAPVIMNLNPYSTPYQLWRIRVGLDPQPIENDAMRRGKELEPFARWHVSDKLGIELFPAVSEHDTISWMGASFDAISSDNKVIVEIKCPGKADHMQALNNIIPEKYVPQLQHQMAVSEIDFIYYFSFDGHEGKILKAYRDDSYIQTMITQEKIFWEQIQTLIPPPLNLRDHIQKDDDEWIKYSSEWKNVNSQLKHLEIVEKEIRSTLINLSKNQSCKGNGVSLTKTIRKGAIEYEKIPELKSLDLEKYRKENMEVWRITSGSS